MYLKEKVQTFNFSYINSSVAFTVHNIQEGIKVNKRIVNTIGDADHTVILANSRQMITNASTREADQFGPRINTEKYKNNGDFFLGSLLLGK